jgi:hypothetical protein
MKPQIIDASELDLSALRAHCREMHAPRSGDRHPRANKDLASWHWHRHFRYPGGIQHLHRGTATLIRSDGYVPAGQFAGPLGWFTGQDAITREQLRDELRARMARGA